MILARGPCYSQISIGCQWYPYCPCAVFLCILHLCPSAHVLLLTHLLPLPETIVGLVKSLPRRDVVAAEKTREVGHAVMSC